MDNLRDKAINIQGKDYVLVSDRVIYFNEKYPNGSIRTELISPTGEKVVVIKATVIPDVSKPERYFNGYSQAVIGEGYINKTSALENAETSAVGRAMAMQGIGVIESIASADEIAKAHTTEPQTNKSCSDKQWKFICKMGKERGDNSLGDLCGRLTGILGKDIKGQKDVSISDASLCIETMMKPDTETSDPEDELDVDQIPL